MTFDKPHNINQLHDELLASVSAIGPVDGEARMLVQSEGERITLTFLVDIDAATQSAIEKVVADHVPKQETQPPKWSEFQARILSNQPYFRIVGHNAVTQTLNASLVWMLGQVGEHPENLPQVMNLWNAIVSQAQASQAEVVELKKIAEDCLMPFSLNDSGFMVPKEV